MSAKESCEEREGAFFGGEVAGADLRLLFMLVQLYTDHGARSVCFKFAGGRANGYEIGLADDNIGT